MGVAARAAKVGYARVSALDQKLDAQLDVLAQAGCAKFFSDRASGATADRPGWEQLIAYVRPGDGVVITEMSRMSRSLAHLLEVVRTFEAQGIELVSLREHIDTATATGRCFLAIRGAIAQMERELKRSARPPAVRRPKPGAGRGDGREPIRTSWNRRVFCISIPTRQRGRCVELSASGGGRCSATSRS